MHLTRFLVPMGCILASWLVIACCEVSARSVTLTFDDATCNGGLVCSNTRTIDPTYGDIPGLVDVRYDRDLGDPLLGPLTFWDSGYGTLRHVAFGAGLASDQVAEIFLASLGSASVRLLGFDLGAWSQPRETQVTILDGNGAQLWSSGPIMIQNVTNLPVNLESNTGIRVQWGPTAYYVAIDNLRFEATPEPSTGALLVSAAFGLAVCMWRRSQADPC